MAATFKFTDRMRIVLAAVWRAQADGRWYRAANSGERVTLASLFTHRFLDRRAWRGQEGERDAAHEYCISEAVRNSSENKDGLPPLMPASTLISPQPTGDVR